MTAYDQVLYNRVCMSYLEVKDWDGSWSISGQFDDGLLTDGYRVIGKDGQGIET
jgi:hypothetical protein